jgi:hypothetical protein
MKINNLKELKDAINTHGVVYSKWRVLYKSADLFFSNSYAKDDEIQITENTYIPPDYELFLEKPENK